MKSILQNPALHTALILALVLAVSLALGACSATSPRPDDGKNFKLPVVEGKTVSLADFSGQKVYLKFWATWCPICLSGLAEFSALSQESAASQDAVILSIVSPGTKGNDRGTQYRTGIYYLDTVDLPAIETVVAEIETQYGAKLATEVLPVDNYYPAEDYHQDYLEKNPDGYCHVDFSNLE